MSVILLFLAVVGTIAAWWLWRERLTAKPWLEEGVIGDFDESPSLPVAKIGLGVFLVVVGALFAVLISAYVMRMGEPDWRATPTPQLLWLNTGALILSSAALHVAQVAAGRGRRDDVVTSLLAAGASALVFLVGQLLAWRVLLDAGYLLAYNPANAFFYLLTALHGLHILGGLAALGRVMMTVHRGTDVQEARLGIELCAMYWHFLLIVWLVLFSVLMHWVDGFLTLCRELLI